ncbi:MAG: hypothetical protein QXD04_04840, partial [Candidatus Bathyarchaeia archaeon]
VIVLCIIYLFSTLILAEPFPTLRYALGIVSRRLIPIQPFEGISQGVSRFLWENRALDVTMQAFVIVVAIICCLALLKPEEAGGP